MSVPTELGTRHSFCAWVSTTLHPTKWSYVHIRTYTVVCRLSRAVQFDGRAAACMYRGRVHSWQMLRR
eukprot:2253286-Ditylum_brightwellii.AAC.1